MALKEPSKATVWGLRVVSGVLFYAAITLALAAVHDSLTAISNRLLEPLHAALPGASLWSSVIDLRGKIGGLFPTPLAVIAGLVAAAGGTWVWAKNINQQIRSDAATARDEAIRLQVRAKSQRPSS